MTAGDKGQPSAATQIDLQERVDGCVLPVRVQPGARREEIVGCQGAALKIAVSAPAEKGQANKAVVDLLRKLLGLKRSNIELLSGKNSRSKRIFVRGASAVSLRAQLAQIVGQVDSHGHKPN